MMHPTVHSNGTSKQALYDQMRAACDALRAAQQAMMEAAPNGRDYYPQGDETFTAAVVQHGARGARIVSVLREYEEMLEHLIDTYGGEGIQ